MGICSPPIYRSFIMQTSLAWVRTRFAPSACSLERAVSVAGELFVAQPTRRSARGSVSVKRAHARRAFVAPTTSPVLKRTSRRSEERRVGKEGRGGWAGAEYEIRT